MKGTLAVLALFLFSAGPSCAEEPVRMPPYHPLYNPRLGPGLPVLEDVVVTATKTPRSLRGVPASVSVVKREEIEKSPARNADDLLKSLPGLDVKRVAGMGAGIPLRVSMRGIPGVNRTLFLVDNLPANAPGTGFLSLNEIPVSAIEKVEVVRGPFSSLYGANAFGGVVSMTTKAVKSNLGGEVQAGWGNEKFSSYGASLEGRNGPSSFWLTADKRSMANYLARDSYETTTVSPATGAVSTIVKKVENHDYRDQRLLGKARIAAGRDAFLQCSFRLFDSELGFGKTSYLSSPRDIKTTGESAMGGVVYERVVSPDLEARVGSYYRRRTDESWNESYSHSVVLPFPPFPSVPVFVPSHSKTVWDEWQVQSTLTSAVSSAHRLSVGADYSWNGGDFSAVENPDTLDPVPGSVPRREHVTNVGVYVQDEYIPLRGLSIVPGMRWDEHSAFGGVISPRVGASWKVLDSTWLRASAGRAFRAPTLAELYMPEWGMPSGLRFKSNPDLDPEYVRAYDAGIEQGLPAKALVRVSAFKNEMLDLISTRTEGTSVVYVNLSRAVSKGVEGEMEWVIAEWLSPFVNYTYQETEDKSSGTRLDYMPRNKGNAGFRFGQPGKDRGLEGSVTGSYTGERGYRDWASGTWMELPEYWRLDLSAGMKYTRTSLVFAVLNATDAKYEETGSIAAPGRIFTVTGRLEF